MQKGLVLVTGASRGIGREIFKQSLEQGYKTIGTATTEKGADSISELAGSEHSGYILDLAEKSSPENLVKAIKQDHKEPILYLINNAGVTNDNLMLRMTDAQWHDVLNVNLSGTFNMTQQVLRDMLKARWGRVVNISSVVSSIGNPGQANYAASKAGVEAMTRSLASELAARNITVNCILPGYIESDMSDQISDDHRSTVLSRIPMKRFGSASDIAKMVVLMLSESTNYMTGQRIVVDGGMYML